MSELLIEQIHALLALKNETPRVPNLARELLTEAADALSASQAEAARLRALLAQAEAALEPFAKTGELFKLRDPESWDQAVYSPAAGREYDLSGDHLRTAASTLAAIRETTP